MSDIFSSIPPFTAGPDCAIPSPLPSGNFVEGIYCPPDNCPATGVPDSNLPYTFLDCYIVGLTGKIGLGGEESSVTIELVDPNPKSCSYVNPSTCPESDILGGYSGALGGVYTVQIGGFSFRGILSKHDYQEGSDGWKYSVTLSDGKQVLSSITVITNDFYTKVTDLQPNLINAVAITNLSVADRLTDGAADNTYGTNTVSCEDGYLCDDFGKAGVNQKGMFVTNAIDAINGQKCKIPESGLCLTINLDNLQTMDVNPQARLSSNFMSALEIIQYACDESGYLFFTQIIGDEIIVIPVSQKILDLPGNNRPLFDFMNTFDKDIIISRDYGEELTYNKTQKLVLGQEYRYMLSIDNQGFVLSEDDYIQTEPLPDGDNCPNPGEFGYTRTKYDWFSGGGTIISDP